MAKYVRPERDFGWDEAERKVGGGVTVRKSTPFKANKKVYWLLIGLIVIIILLFLIR